MSYTPLAVPPVLGDLVTAVRRIGAMTRVRIALLGTATVTLHGWTGAGWVVIGAGISSPGTYTYALGTTYGAVHLEVTSGAVTSVTLRWQQAGAEGVAVSTSAPLVGDGTTGSPVRLDTGGATEGQVVKFSGEKRSVGRGGHAM